MVTIVLPGYSLKNRDWAYEVKKNLEPKIDVVVHEWQHWNNSLSSGLSLSAETEMIVKELEGVEIFNIIAKSIGTLVCMKLLNNLGRNKINKVVLCGICLNDLREEDFLAFDVLKTVDAIKILVFQNSNDPHGNYQQAFTFLDKINPKIKIIKKEADTHDYPYYDDFGSLLK